MSAAIMFDEDDVPYISIEQNRSFDDLIDQVMFLWDNWRMDSVEIAFRLSETEANVERAKIAGTARRIEHDRSAIQQLENASND